MHKTTLLTAAFFCSLLFTAAPSFAQDKAQADILKQARASYDSGAWEKAVSLYKQAYKSSGDKSPEKVEAGLEVASILWEQGSYKKAQQYAEDALTRARKIKYERIIGRLMLTLGHIESSQGRFSTARNTFKICVSVAKKTDPVFSSLCRMNLSMVQKAQGKKGVSTGQLKKDIRRLENVGTPLTAGSALAKTAEFFIDNRDYVQARLLLDQAHKHFKAAGSVPATARNHLRIARVAQLMGDPEAARTHVMAAIGPLQKMKNRPALVNAYGLLGKDAQIRGDLAKAKGYYQKSLSTAKAIGNPQLRARGHLALCELLAKETRNAQAELHCTQASTRFAKLGVYVLASRATISLANIKQNLKNLNEARTLYIKAINMMEKRVSPSKIDKPTLATQYANLCQVNHALKATGTLLSCKKAITALTKLPQPQTYASHIAATYYAAGFGAQREKRIKVALRHFEKAAQTYAKLTPVDHLRAADSYLRMGVIYSVVLKGENNAEKAFRKGLMHTAKDNRPETQSIKTQLLMQLSQVQFEQKNYQEAEKTIALLLTQAASQNARGSQANGYNLLANIRLKNKDRTGAIKALEDGIRVIQSDSSQKDLLKMMKSNLAKLKK